MAVFLGIVVGIGYLWSQSSGNPAILIGALVLSIIINIGSFWFSDKIVIASTGAVPVDLTNPQHREYRRLTENLAITAGLPMPALYVLPDPSLNAFATGRSKDHSAVAVTQGLLDNLAPRELEGVIAHELSHIGNRDMQLMTVAVILVGFVTLAGDWLSRIVLFGQQSDSENNNGAISFLLVIVVSIVVQIGAFMLQMAISRKREYLADASAALLTRYPQGLADALKKISGYRGPVHTGNSAVAHLFIAEPMRATRTNRMMSLFNTHPPVAERIKRLEQMGA
jgi:heat shock protein HtpX